MYEDLAGKTAVVTGASSGLGYGIAKRFLTEGMNVVINHHRPESYEAAQNLADKFNTPDSMRAVVVQADISTEEGARKLLDSAISSFGRLDVWVNNAGMETRCPTHKRSLDAWNKTISVNLTGVFLGSREALAHFVEQDKPGVIINMSSVHEIIPWPTFTDYAASKGGVMLFSKSIALEYASRNIRVNCIAPGAIETPINAEKFADKEARALTESMIPADRIGEIHDVTAAAAWLASDESRYVTGISLFVDGGMSLYPSFERGDG